MGDEQRILVNGQRSSVIGQPHLACVGEITIDRYLRQGLEMIGGTSLNFAIHAQRCGAAVSLVSCVGDDAGGERALAYLRREGIDSTCVAVRSGATAHQGIIVEPDGERIFPPGGYGAGVLADWTPNAADLRAIRKHDVIVAPSFRQVAHIFEAAMADPSPNTRRVADFLDWHEIGGNLAALERALTWLDIAFVSGNEQTIAALRPFARQHNCLVVVTLGAAGSVALHGDTLVHQTALPVVDLVDTTGCGDAFGAAFTVSYCQYGDLGRALEAGAQQAAQVIGHYGAS